MRKSRGGYFKQGISSPKEVDVISALFELTDVLRKEEVLVDKVKFKISKSLFNDVSLVDERGKTLVLCGLQES